MSDRIHVVDHPLIQHKLTILRNEKTGPKKCRELVRELSTLMAYEATKHFALEEVEIQTPVQRAKTFVLAGKKVAVVAIIRAGLGMVDGILDLVPNAKVGHVGVYRDPETLKPVQYFYELPEDIGQREILVLDAALSTGGSATSTIKFLKEKGAGAISLICIVASPEGISRVAAEFDDVHIYTAAIDEYLDKDGMIVPGIGDAGDRLWGTE